VRGVPDSFRTSTTDETKDGMDIDPEGELPHDEHVPAVASEAAPVAAAVTAPTTFSPRTSHNRRRSIPFALLGILTIGTGLAAFFAVRESTTPSEAVASALTNSLRFKTAAITTSIGVKEPGGTTTITSEGVTNFDTAASTQVLRIVNGNERIGEVVVSDGPEIYVHLDGGIIGKVAAGKSWVAVPSGQSVATGVTGGGGASNAAAILRVLSASGNDVSDLGPSQVNGYDVHLYSVHLTRSQINRDIAQEHLPQFVRQAVALVNIPAITYTLAINGANQLTRMTATLRLHADGQQIVEYISAGYSHYGTQVKVAAPPAREVIPFQKYLQLAQEKGMNAVI
jgi:hypothetical protein